MSAVIELAPLTRIEGHGKVFVHLAGSRVVKVQLALTEPPRLFEALLLGKRYDEIPDIVCRICSICSTVHRVTALQAIERAFGLEVSEQTRLYRELAVIGGHIESHALHLFLLVLPDILGVSGFQELARTDPEGLGSGLRIKRVGNLIQERVGGRVIHPVNLLVAGIGKPPAREHLLEIKEALQEILPEVSVVWKRFLPKKASSPPADWLAIAGGTEFPLFGTMVRWRGGVFDSRQYRDRIVEKVTPHSHAKLVTVDGAFPTVGALARLQNDIVLPQGAADAFAAAFAGSPEDAGMMANPLGQAIELVAAVERGIALVDELLEETHVREYPFPVEARAGEGSAAAEAPRGLLIHHYGFDSRGVCTKAEIITPTALNQGGLERDLLHRAKSFEKAPEQEMKRELEILVRAYDPCISCAVHVIPAGDADV